MHELPKLRRYLIPWGRRSGDIFVWQCTAKVFDVSCKAYGIRNHFVPAQCRWKASSLAFQLWQAPTLVSPTWSGFDGKLELLFKFLLVNDHRWFVEWHSCSWIQPCQQEFSAWIKRAWQWSTHTTPRTCIIQWCNSREATHRRCGVLLIQVLVLLLFDKLGGPNAWAP